MLRFSGLKMRKKMASEGVRLVDVGDCIGKSIPTVSAQLNGRSPLSAQLVCCIAELTNTPVGEFVESGDEDEAGNESARVRSLRAVHIPNAR